MKPESFEQNFEKFQKKRKNVAEWGNRFENGDSKRYKHSNKKSPSKKTFK